MATEYTTQEEYMNQMLGAPSSAERDFGLGGESASPATTATAPQEATQTPAVETKSASTPNLRGYSSIPGTGQFGDLFAPVKKTLADVSTGIGQEQTNFDQAAGARRNFAGIGGQNTLDQAFQESASPDQVAQAKGLVNSKYSGPLGFDQGSVEKLRESLYGAKEDAKAAKKATGAGYFAGLANPGMSSGERRFEGARDVQDQGYQAKVRDLEMQAGQGLAGIDAKNKAASAYAKGRQQDEASIASAARQIASQRQAEALAAVDANVAQRKAQEQALQDAYDKFTASGSVQDLAALPGDQGEVIQAGQDYQAATSAKGVWDAVMANYSDIANVPLLERQVSTHGHAVLGFPDSWWKTEGIKYTKPEIAQIRARANARQADLEKAGFAAEERAGLGGRGVLSADVGKNAPFRSLYGDIEGVTPQDPRSYFGLDIGTEATRENTASKQQRFMANRAAEIMGQLEQIGENTTPYEASRIAGDGKTYLDDLAKAIADKKLEITGDRDEALKNVKEARKAYQKAVRKKHFALAARVLVGTGTMGFSEVPVGGKPASERFAAEPLANSATITGL